MNDQAGQVEKRDRGSTICFAELVENTEPILRRLLSRMCGRRADVDDLVQETYLRAWRGLGRFRGESSVTTWMMRIAVNVSRSWARVQRPTLPLSEHMHSALLSREHDSDTAVIDAYQHALAQLSPEHRAVFELHEVDGLSYQEIAVTLGCPIGTVMSRLHRARACLLDQLHEQIEELSP